jgi:hypothetical protein
LSEIFDDRAVTFALSFDLSKDHERSGLELQDEAEFNALRDDLEYILQGLGYDNSDTPSKKRTVSATRLKNMQLSSLYNLAKLTKQKPQQVGQLLRSTPGLLQKLYVLLNQFTDNEDSEEVTCILLYLT